MALLKKYLLEAVDTIGSWDTSDSTFLRGHDTIAPGACWALAPGDQTKSTEHLRRDDFQAQRVPELRWAETTILRAEGDYLAPTCAAGRRGPEAPGRDGPFRLSVEFRRKFRTPELIIPAQREMRLSNFLLLAEAHYSGVFTTRNPLADFERRS